jgi:carboxymethylenebutenolidase
VSELIDGSRQARVDHTTITGTDGTSVLTIHAAPTDGPVSGAVVLHPDIMGVRPLFDDLCRRLATHGFAVACPEPYARASAEVRDAEDATARMAALPELDDDLQLGDLAAAADLLTERDGAAIVSVMGFCMGGMQTLKAAASGRFTRAVSFYGMVRLPEGWQGGGVREPLPTVSDVCPTLAIFGGVDHFTPTEDIDALRAAWSERSDCEIVVYPEADHGFIHVPERPAHRADDAADAWRRTLAWLPH